MSEVWPADVVARIRKAGLERIRSFKCLLLMPFESRFNEVANQIHSCVREVMASSPEIALPEIKRLDWVTSSGAIQNEIWEEIASADLIFCDVTGYNPNVMFEAGVAAAIKRLSQVVFIRDHFFKQQSPFDIAPIRYTEYSLTSDGIPEFREKIKKLVIDAYIAYPDDLIDSLPVAFPADIDFLGNHDDLRLYTPPLAHRRVVDNALEFGSIPSFPDSWASLGNERVMYFDLECDVAFRKATNNDSWIGIGFRSQNYFANFAHILYLKLDGSIIITQPNEDGPQFYTDVLLRATEQIDKNGFHHFHVRLDSEILFVAVDNFSKSLELKFLPKVLGPGLIRFQSALSWMVIKGIRVRKL